MRRATLWSVMLAATLAACGSDGSDPKMPAGDGDGDDVTKGTDDVSDGSGDGADSPADDALCPLAAGGGLGPYMGPLTWTAADFTACKTACPDFDDACITASCAAGFDTFNTCVGAELNACMSAKGGPCRDEFEAHICCADDKCDLNDAANAATCVADQCPDTRQGFLDCGSATGIKACINTAVPLCLSPSAGDTTTGGTTTDPTTTIPSEVAFQLMLGQASWHSPVQSPSAGSME
jgi:hypothetical protein